MQITYDFHTHTKYSHGKGTILDNAIAAKEKGMKGIAITDHGFSHPAFGMKRKRLAQMRKDCVEAEKQTGVKILLGTESNICGQSGKTDVLATDYENLDVFGAGIHRFVYYDTPYDYLRLLGDTIFFSITKIKPSKSLINYTTKVYVNAIKKNPIDFISHLNFLVFCDVETVAKACADYGTYLEISTKKVHLSDEQWEKVFKTDVKFVINSDAHSPSRVGDMILFNELNQRVDVPIDRIVNLGDELPRLRFNEFKKTL